MKVKRMKWLTFDEMGRCKGPVYGKPLEEWIYGEIMDYVVTDEAIVAIVSWRNESIEAVELEYLKPVAVGEGE